MSEQTGGKYGSREDDALKREVRSELQAHRATRAEEWLEPEPPGEDEPEATWAPEGRPGGTRSARFLADRPHLTAEDLAPKSRLERLGEPEDVARVVEFLVTDLSDFVTGQNIKVDGRP